MLVLSRRIGDEITLPELGVTIRLLKIKGNTASVGIDAPREYAVLRGELSHFDRDPAAQPTIPMPANCLAASA